MLENAVICAMPREYSRVPGLNWPAGQVNLGTLLDLLRNAAVKNKPDRTTTNQKEASQVVSPPLVFPSRGKSGKPDGGRPAGRVLAYY